MSLSSLVKKLVFKDEPWEDDTPIVSAPAAIVPNAFAGPLPVVLCHEEIINAQGKLSGYRLRASGRTQAIADGDNAILNALRGGKGAILLEHGMTLIHVVPACWSAAAWSGIQASQLVFVVAAPKNAQHLDGWLDTVNEMKSARARVAITGLDLANAFADALAAVDIALLDLHASSLQEMELLVRTLTRSYPDLRLIAENVASWPEYRMCQSWGLTHCLGGFIATVDVDDSRENVSPGQVVLLEMLNQLRRDAELPELCALAKRDPGVTLQILATANSALFGGGAVSNVDQAILRLGRDRLYRSLSIALFRLGSDPRRDEALLELTLARARFMELAAAESETSEQCAELFVVGMLSLVDRLLKQPMSRIVERMRLSGPVAEVLLHNDGPHAAYLSLATAVEHGDTALAWELAAGLGIPAEVLESASIEALAWARQAMAVAA